MALKNIGAWLAAYTIADIKVDPTQFVFSLAIFMLINVPADLYLLNHWSQEEG